MSEGEGGKGRSVELCESVEGMWWPRMGGGEDHGDVDGEGEVGGVSLFESGNETFFEPFGEHVTVEVIMIVSSRMFRAKHHLAIEAFTFVELGRFWAIPAWISVKRCTPCPITAVTT